MGLKEQIENDLKVAMKARDELRLGVLRMIRADMLNQERAGAAVTTLTEEQLTARLEFLLKQRRDSATAFRDGGREDLASKEDEEGKIIAAYLPAGASDAEIGEAVDLAISATGATGVKDIGKVMGKALGALKAGGKRVDGGAVNRIARERLGG